MLALLVTFFLILIAAGGWLFLKRDPDRYIHEKKSPINFFFKWGHVYHHFFKIAIIAAFMITIFSLYKYLLGASNILATVAATIAGVVLSGGKELLDKNITFDDVISSFLGIVFGLIIVLLIF